MNKKGALELSIGTIVVIVIGMSMLVLGLVLVRQIFSGATDSVDEINQGVRDEVVKLFGDDTGDLVIKLGSTKTARVKPGEEFNVLISVRHPDGEAIVRDTIQYKIELDKSSSDNCLAKLGERRTEDLFITNLGEWLNFDDFQGSTGFALIQTNVPKGTAQCTQKVEVDVKLKDETTAFEGSFFLLDIGKEGIFG